MECSPFRRGAAIQIRTGDLILTKDALYQLSYSSALTAQLVYHSPGDFARGFCEKVSLFAKKLPSIGKGTPPMGASLGSIPMALGVRSLDQTVEQSQALAAVQLADGLGLDLAHTLTGDAKVPRSEEHTSELQSR